MRIFAAVLVTLTLAGCAGGGSNEACQAFSPPPPMAPTAQNSERVEALSTGDRTWPAGGQGC